MSGLGTKTCGFGLLSLLAWSIQVAAATPASREFRVFLPVIVESEAGRDSEAVVRAVPGVPGQLDRLRPEPLLTSLQEWLDPPILASLRSKLVQDEVGKWLPVREIEMSGLTVTYDERSLEVRVGVPAGIRKRGTVSILGRTTPAERVMAETILPSAVSSYVNAFAAQDLVTGQHNGTRTRQPFRTDLDGAINGGGIVLEGSGKFAEKQPRGFNASSIGDPNATAIGGWTRGDVRLVRDWEGEAIRFSAGDLAYSIAGFQRFRPMAGVSAVTNFNIQPYRIITPVGREEIFLRTNSIVRVFLNGRLLQTFTLPAGRHDLRDFPFNVGSNELTLEITDDVGRVETIRLPYLFSDQLLAPGVHQVSYAVGVPSDNMDPTDPTRRTYRGGKETFIVSHRVGVSEVLSLGGYAQGDPAQVLGGALLTYSTQLGTFTLEPAISRFYAGEGLGAGGRVGYLHTDYLGIAGTQRNLALFVERRSPRFALLGDRAVANPRADLFGRTAWDVGASYGQQIARLTSFNLAGSYQFNRPGLEATGNSFNLNSSLGRTWTEGLDTTLTLTRRFGAFGEGESVAFLLLTWAFPEKKQYIWAAGSTEEFARVQWNYNSASNQAGSVNLLAGAETTQNGKRVDFQADYTGNRGRASLIQEVLPGRDPGGIPDGPRSRTGLRASSALVFVAGGDGVGAALSRPVTDSFALVRTEGGLRELEVLLNPQQPDTSKDPDYEAASGMLGPAARPELVSYRFDQMHVIADRADATTPNLPRENFVLKPTYKSGTLVPIRAESTLYVVGVLTNAKDIPVQLWSGELWRLGGPEAPVQVEGARVVFTNREGRFVIESVLTGEYEVRALDSATHARFRFNVPEQRPGLSKVEIQVKLEEGGRP